MNRGYLDPQAEGYLLEAKACERVSKELWRVADKMDRAVKKEKAARQTEFESVMEYRSETEIQDAYGYAFITEKQYARYLDLFREGRAALEHAAPTKTEAALRILHRILRDLAEEQREWEFSALTPMEQLLETKRAEASQRTWKEKIKEIRRNRGIIDADDTQENEKF